MKAIFLRCLLVFLGCAVGLMLAEGILRILNTTHVITIDKKNSFANDPFLYSPTLKYRIKPYFTRNCTFTNNPPATCYANELGFRDTDHDFKKPANTYRIVLIGDSLTYGPGVNFEDSYPGILEKIIKKNNKSMKKIEVIKLGMIFYAPQQYYSLYEEYGKKYDPDLIILSFHLLTDPYDAYEFNENKRFYFLKSIPDILPYQISQPLKEHSYVFKAALSAYYGWANNQEIKIEEKVFQGKKNRYQYFTQVSSSTPFMKEGWKHSEHYVNSLIKDASLNGSKIVVVSFPSPVQVIPDEWKIMKKKGYISDEKLYNDSVTRKEFLRLCTKHKWKCLDLQNDLRKAEDLRKLFLIGDIHLTKEGNSLAAKAIYNFVKGNLSLEH